MIFRILIRKAAVLFLVLFVFANATAQIGIGVNPPDPSAMLHVQSTAKGLLIPRMTAAQKNAINTPAESLLVYQTDCDKGFWYFIDGQWKNMTSINNGGKHTLILSDKISNSEAAVKIAMEAGPNTQVVKIVRCSQLTTVDLSMLTNLTELYLSADTVLQFVNLDNVESVDAGIFIDQCPLLSNMPMSKLKKIGLSADYSYAFRVANTSLINLNFPLLTEITGSVYIRNNNSLTSINCPQLTEQVVFNIPFQSYSQFGFDISLNPVLSNISFPLLTKVGDLVIAGNFNNINSLDLHSLVSARDLSITSTKITSLSLTALKECTRYLFINGHTLLTTLSLPQLVTAGYPGNGSALGISGNAVLNSLSLPLFTTAGDFNVDNNNALSTVSFPLLSKVNHVSLINSPLITSISFPSLTGFYGGGNNSIISCANLTSLSLNNSAVINTFFNESFKVTGSKLPSSNINYLLNKFVSIPPANFIPGTLDFRQSIPAPPTGQGVTDKSTLISMGNTVYTD